MATWTCSYCTLVNPLADRLCGACGSENPSSIKPRKSFLPKIIAKPISSVKTTLVDIFTDDRNYPPRPPQNIIIASASSSSQIQNVYTSTPSTHKPAMIPRTASAPVFDNNLQWLCENCHSYNSNVNRNCRACKTHRTYRENSEGDLSCLKSASQITSNCSEITNIVDLDDRARAAETYNRIVEHCRSSNTIFIDDAFPHSNKSLGDLPNGAQAGTVGSIPTDFVWLKPEYIYTKDGKTWNWSIFRDPRSSDIEQGSLGDCWLLSAMALIAERPDILDSVVLTKVYNPYGVYQIRICVDGTWCVVTVDAFFPCRANRNTLAFAVGRKNQLWVPLIEKAIAKRLGCYANIVGGRTIEGLSMLTGLPCQTLSLEVKEPGDDEYLWAQLLSANEAGFILGCSCGSHAGEVDTEMYRAKGLTPRHAYSILDLCVEKQFKLIRLRNPWGSFVWNGAFSDNWPCWDKDSKERLLKEKIAGSFWMTFKDFMQHFDRVDLAKIRYERPWTDTRIPIQLGGAYDPSDKCIRFIIEQPTEMCFSLYHTDSRQTEDRIDLLICVHERTREGKIGKLIFRSPRTLESFVCTEDTFFSPGEYVIVCHSMSQLGYAKQAGCLAIHSSVSVFGELISCSSLMYRDSLIQLMIKDGNQTFLHQNILVRSITKTIGGLILMVDNNSPDSYIHMTTDCSSSNNVVSSRGTVLMADSVPPKSRQIIVVLTQLEHTSSYLVGHRIPPVRFSKFPALGELALDENTIEAMHSPLMENETSETVYCDTSVISCLYDLRYIPDLTTDMISINLL
ncbi:unnamed protein product [Auanema sp. JU1783]|nr:unnamed protein product [Auanema sp. JU1783]